MNKMPLLEDTVFRENEICTQMAILTWALVQEKQLSPSDSARQRFPTQDAGLVRSGPHALPFNTGASLPHLPPCSGPSGALPSAPKSQYSAPL